MRAETSVSPAATNPLTGDRLIEAFWSIGLRKGVAVVVHGSMKSFGVPVAGGAETVIQALQEVIGDRGTLLMPSFNFGRFQRCGTPGEYNPQRTATAVGLTAETFWKMPCVHRSLNPTHPVAAWGQRAREYVAHHHRTLTMGVGSPLGLAYRDGGVCLFIGVGYRSNTFHHVVETMTDAPCLGQRTEEYPVALPSGRIVAGRSWSWRAAPCPITDRARYRTAMHGLHTQNLIAGTHCVLTFYRLQDAFEVIARRLAGGLGAYPSCRRCQVRPRHCENTVPSDWDERLKQPSETSSCWTY